MPARKDEAALPEPLLTELLGALDGWAQDGASITKTFTCRGFKGAIALVNAVADAANAADHHPDIHLESYKNVRIVLTTHDVKGISQADIDLAAKIDRLARVLAA